jgi:hypothetical protein
LLVGHGFCKKETIIDNKNEFGGKTEQSIYDKSDKRYKEGIWKIVELYDANEKIREIESFYTPEHSKKDGVRKREQYYYQSITETRLTKTEFYYTDEYSDYNGIYKCEEKYHENGNKKVSEFFYTDEWAKKRVVSKMIIDYDSKGLEKKRTYYDSKGKVLSKEEK